MSFWTINEAIEDIKAGKFVIVVDDEKRENEGDLVIAAEKATPEKINFMLRYARGLLCLAITGKRLHELKIPQMVQDNTEITRCAFTVSIDAKKGTTTGISAYDRARTIKAVLDPDTTPEDLLRPGHMFPLRYEEGGVLKRPGHTEAAVDLSIGAGLYPAAVISEILDEDGGMATLDELVHFAGRYGIRIISINDLVEYLKR